MQVILRERSDNLGKSGEVVNVKPGYGRNYLLPRGLAILATAGDIKRVEHEKRVIAARTAKMAKEPQAEADKLSQVSVSIAAPRRRRRQALRLGHHARHRRGARPRASSVDCEEDPARRADQGAGDDRGAGEARAEPRRHDQGLGRQERISAHENVRGRLRGRCGRLRAHAPTQHRRREVGAGRGVHQAGGVRRGRDHAAGRTTSSCPRTARSSRRWWRSTSAASRSTSSPSPTS